MEKIMQNKKFVKIICVTFAIILWFYVSYQENPSMTKTVKNVPITIVGEQALKENGLSVYSISEQSVDVKATAKRLSLARINNKTLNATINVSSIKKPGVHIIPASISSGVSSGSFYAIGNDITVVVEPILTKSFGIKPDIVVASGASVKIKSTKLSVDKVYISAPKSLINEIDTVRTEKVIVGNKGGSQTVKLVAYAKNGKVMEGVEFKPSEVTVSYSLYNIKTVPIVLKTTSGESHSLPSDYLVEVYGSAEDLDLISMIETEPVNIYEHEAGSTINVPLALPENIFINKGTPDINIVLEEDFYSDI